MLELETIFQILDVARDEGMECVERPPADLRSEFGFGRSHGILITVARIRSLIENEIKRRTDTENMQENDLG